MLQPRVDMLEPRFDVFEPRFDVFEPCFDVLEPCFDVLEPCFDVPQSALNSVKPKIRLCRKRIYAGARRRDLDGENVEKLKYSLPGVVSHENRAFDREMSSPAAEALLAALRTRRNSPTANVRSGTTRRGR